MGGLIGIRDDLYQDVDRLYQRKVGRIHFLKEKSLQAIREGQIPEGLDEQTRANWERVRALVKHGEALADRRGGVKRWLSYSMTYCFSR